MTMILMATRARREDNTCKFPNLSAVIRPHAPKLAFRSIDVLPAPICVGEARLY